MLAFTLLGLTVSGVVLVIVLIITSESRTKPSLSVKAAFTAFLILLTLSVILLLPLALERLEQRSATTTEKADIYEPTRRVR